MNILVTGGDGQLGTCIRVVLQGMQKHLLKDSNYIFCNRDSLDITDKEAIMANLIENKVDIVINCAAYTDVKGAQTDNFTALLINRDGARNLAECCKETNAQLIHISTDYVYDGYSSRPYIPSDRPRPLNAYGTTKRMGEIEIEQSGCKYLIFRTSWLFSNFGHNFVKTIYTQLYKTYRGGDKSEFHLPCDQIGSPTHAEDLAMFLVDITCDGKCLEHTGIYHYANKGVASWYDLALEVKYLMGGDEYDERYIIKPRRSDYAEVIRRPNFTVLNVDDTERDFRVTISPWRHSLLHCLRNVMMVSVLKV